MLFPRRTADGDDVRQGDKRELNLRVLIVSTVVAILLLTALYFGFGFADRNYSTSGPVNTEAVEQPATKTK